jgi:hypothetical protein
MSKGMRGQITHHVELPGSMAEKSRHLGGWLETLVQSGYNSQQSREKYWCLPVLSNTGRRTDSGFAHAPVSDCQLFRAERRSQVCGTSTRGTLIGERYSAHPPGKSGTRLATIVEVN